MSISQLGSIAAQYSRSMDSLAQQLSNPELIKDPGALAQFQTQMMLASSGYTLAARTAQNMHQEDQVLSDLLRDA